MTDDRKKISARHTIPDDRLDLLPKTLIHETVGAVLAALDEQGKEVDWTTLDLRIFRDVSLEAMERDPYLLVRADVLTKGAKK